MKKLVATLVLLVLAGIAGGAYYRYKNKPKPPDINTAAVTRGEVVDVVGATGTIQAVTTVQVGSQVSGTVQNLYADFNSIVHKGQVVARLDPSLFETQVAQSRANLVRAQADVERQVVAVEDARQKLTRSAELLKRQLIPQQDYDANDLALKSAQAQLQSTRAQVTQAQATLNQNEVNLNHTVISAPIDGIVISRNVDVGQTVAASFQAPVLFVIAADLTAMQVNASVDEADAGRIRPGQRVRFRVDAYPNDEFFGTVSQLRLQPIVVQNVTTYATVIDVPNRDLRLKPGMTANVNIEVARRDDVLRVPTAALRFRPTPEIFAAFNQPVPPELQRGFGRGTGETRTAGATGGSPTGSGGGAGTVGNASGTPTASAAQQPTAQSSSGRRNASNATQTPSGQAPSAGAGGRPGAPPASADGMGDGSSGSGGPRAGNAAGGSGRGAASAGAQAGSDSTDQSERRQRFMERLQQMSPEEREQALQRMRERGIQVGEGGPGSASAAPNAQRKPGGDQPGAGAAEPRRGTGQNAMTARGDATSPGTTADRTKTIDSLFGPLQTPETGGRVWVFGGGELKMVRVRLGISDGTNTELRSDELKPGQEVVTSIILNTPQSSSNSGAGRSPLTPGGPPRGGPPGMRNAPGGGGPR